MCEDDHQGDADEYALLIDGLWDEETRRLAFKFLCMFGRMEFALKAAKFLKNREIAEADWDCYGGGLDRTQGLWEKFSPVAADWEIVRAQPKKLKKKAEGGVISLFWDDEDYGAVQSFSGLQSALRRLRNNLAHGSKAVRSEAGGSNERDKALLETGIKVMKFMLENGPNDVKSAFLTSLLPQQ